MVSDTFKNLLGGKARKKFRLYHKSTECWVKNSNLIQLAKDNEGFGAVKWQDGFDTPPPHFIDIVMWYCDL